MGTAVLLLASLCITGIDEDLREDVRYGWRGPVQDVVARSLHIGFDWRPLLAADAVAWAAGDARLRGTAEQAAVSLAGAGAALFAVRAVVRRPRPEYEPDQWWDTGFPSGHVTTFFSIATVYARRYPGLRWPLGVTGLLLGLSRVYLGEHYPSDVLAGAALGTGTGLLVAACWPERGVTLFRSSRWEVVPAFGARDGSGGVGAVLRF